MTGKCKFTLVPHKVTVHVLIGNDELAVHFQHLIIL